MRILNSEVDARTMALLEVGGGFEPAYLRIINPVPIPYWRPYHFILMVPFILYELSNGFLNFLHRAFKESHANLILLGDVTHTLLTVCRVVTKCERTLSLWCGIGYSKPYALRHLSLNQMCLPNSTNPAYLICCGAK